MPTPLAISALNPVAAVQGTDITIVVRSGSITGVTNANPANITSTAHGLTSGDIVVISGVGGSTGVNVSTGLVVTVIDADTFSVPVAAGGAYTSGGSWLADKSASSTQVWTIPFGSTVQFVSGNGIICTISSDNDGGINITDQGGRILNWNAWDNNGLQLNGADLVMNNATGSGGATIYMDGGSIFYLNTLSMGDGETFSGTLYIQSTTGTSIQMNGSNGSVSFDTGAISSNGSGTWTATQFVGGGAGITGVAYTSLSGAPTLGTAALLNVGVSANQIVQLDGSAKLPAVDGSQLIGITATPSLPITANSGTPVINNSLGIQLLITDAPGNLQLLCKSNQNNSAGFDNTSQNFTVVGGKYAGDGSVLSGITAAQVGTLAISFDTGWTANTDNGDKTSSVTDSGTISTMAATVDPTSAGLGPIMIAMANKIKALEYALTQRLFPNA